MRLGNYSNPLLANVVWGVCILLWLYWLIGLVDLHETSPEARTLSKQISHFDNLGGFIAEGETILLKMSMQTYIDAALKDEKNNWADTCHRYLRQEYSAADASTFIQFHLAKANSGGLTENVEQQTNRLDYLRKLRDGISASLKPKRIG